MTSAAELHDEAMRLAAEGDELRRAGRSGEAGELYAAALDHARTAAGLAVGEPTRGISYRSAAWLALDAGVPDEAARLAEVGLAGDQLSERVLGELWEVRGEARARMAAVGGGGGSA